MPPLATGANVDESRVQQILCVDAASVDAADDDKHGTADAPFATIRFACRAAEKAKDAGKGVKILIAAGTYREAVEIHAPANGKSDTDAPLVIEAAEHDQTVIDGADIEGWTPSTWRTGDGHWTHPWTSTQATARPVPSPVGRQPPAANTAAYHYGDLVLVDGVPLRQVNALADLVPGSFWSRLPAPTIVGAGRKAQAAVPFDPANGAAVFVQPPEGMELVGAIIQVGVRPRGVVITGRRNVIVRGLLIQHAAAPTALMHAENPATGLTLDGCANVLVEDVLCQWNDGTGLEITAGRVGGQGAADVTLRRVRLLHNGGAGLSVEGGRNLLAEDCETSFNNFRGEWAGWIDPHRRAAVKTNLLNGSTWRRQRTVGNAGRGLWFAGGTNLTVEDAVVRENFVSGILLDAEPGPTLVRRSLIAETKLPPSLKEEAGGFAAVSVYASPDVTLEGNIVAANAVPALGLSEMTPGSEANGKNGASGLPAMRAERHTYRRNVLYGKDVSQVLVDWPGTERVGRADFSTFYKTLSLVENCCWNPKAGEVFCAYDKIAHHRPGMNFDAWGAFLAARTGGGGAGPEAKSHWNDPAFVDSDEGDFRLQDDSPCKEWELPGEENAAGQ